MRMKGEGGMVREVGRKRKMGKCGVTEAKIIVSQRGGRSWCQKLLRSLVQ